MPNKSHFSLFAIKNFVLNKKKTHVHSIYIDGLKFVR